MLKAAHTLKLSSVPTRTRWTLLMADDPPTVTGRPCRVRCRSRAGSESLASREGASTPGWIGEIRAPRVENEVSVTSSQASAERGVLQRSFEPAAQADGKHQTKETCGSQKSQARAELGAGTPRDVGSLLPLQRGRIVDEIKVPG